ncbi:aminopeptidase P family protein [Kineothrix sp. MSJ-39]|uniref:aminopeptidase P family protein n=1 Tax=Kineothrix sp. MSJ-39 TaxID=2841533 RepID=UPI001C112D6E|nr:aminopeptidase P family protein [Kineothrix sp. MSJ-39]MBU5428998.1 aminopeptidase P family protein [Kineothrix sp. MSJ-39]
MSENIHAARINQLRSRMQQEDLRAYLIPMNDFHGSEYIGEYFKTIAWFGGFTGSAATLLVTETESLLWTDGRYFLQAEEQLAGTGIRLMKMGEANVPTVTAYIAGQLQKCKQAGKTMRIGFDGRVVGAAYVEKLQQEIEELCGQKAQIEDGKDLAGEIWGAERPPLSKEPIWELALSYAGVARDIKLKAAQIKMQEQGVDYLILTSLDEIAWILNLRGNDIAYNPVFLSYLVLSKTRATLYVRSRESLPVFEEAVDVRAYEDFYQDLQSFPAGSKIWLDVDTVNYKIVSMLAENYNIVISKSPVALEKAVKNHTEVENERQAHIWDGVAVTRFIRWLKTEVRTGKEEATELSAAEKLEGYRKQMPHYLGQSFAPIIAYGSHGAIVHYEPTEETDIPIGKESFLLADTGGHYLEGTTDITRTIVMGPITKLQKQHYTAVLLGNLRLMDAKFRYGLSGAHLDYLAREPLYRMGLDFKHGTGHGVGYLLNVHEGPNAIRSRVAEDGVFKQGMITSDEPGLYIEGAYGIRLENLLLCVHAEKTEYGQFMKFEPLTFVPFDPEAIDWEMLSGHDKELFEGYQKQVYETLAPHLTEEEKQWLLRETRNL